MDIFIDKETDNIAETVTLLGILHKSLGETTIDKLQGRYRIKVDIQPIPLENVNND